MSVFSKFVPPATARAGTPQRSVLHPTHAVLVAALYLLFFGIPEARATNNDGKTDIYLRNYSTGDNVFWVMNGTNYVSQTTMDFVSSPDWKMAGTGDFNHDGELDLLWRNQVTGINIVWFLYAGEFLAANYIQSLTDPAWQIVGTGYFGGINDNYIDILWRNGVTGDNAIWHMNKMTLVSSELIMEVPDLDWKVGGTGDFNNDGHWDLLWRNVATGQNGYWLMQGSAYVTSLLIQTEASASWEIVGTGYMNNDNKLDILWQHSNGSTGFWLMNGTNMQAGSFPSVTSGWKIEAAGDARLSQDPVTVDALPDIWERRYFGALNQANSGDPDGDGLSNKTEYENGTNPTVGNAAATLGNALEANTLEWTSGGNTSWGHYTGDSTTGGDSARSGAIGNNELSWLKLTVLGPGSYSFDWKVSSATGDVLRHRHNGMTTEEMSGSGTWETYLGSLGPGTNVLEFQYAKDASGTGGLDAGLVDNFQLTINGNSGAGNTLAEAVDDTPRLFQESGDPFYFQTTTCLCEGDAAQSVFIGNNAIASFQTTLTGPGTVKFYWKVSSELNHDKLRFKINGADYGVISGEVDWTEEVITVPSGTLQMVWTYEKDQSNSDGQDKAWVDDFVFFPDYDQDGLGDGWETTHFGNLTSQNGTGDYDGDGVNNLQEYLNGTNPTIEEMRVKLGKPATPSNLP